MRADNVGSDPSVVNLDGNDCCIHGVGELNANYEVLMSRNLAGNHYKLEGKLEG